MSYEQTDAIVLKIVEFSESSCIVSLLTRDFGKIQVIAKGARRLKNPFDNSIDLLCLCRATFINKQRDSLDILTEAKLLRRFRAASRDLNRLYSGYYVAELLNALTDNHNPDRPLFELAERVLSEIDCQDSDLLRLLLEFQLQMLNQLGQLPALGECADCGKIAPLQTRYFFSPLHGGLLCSTCRKTRKSVISISLEARQKMQALADPSADRPRTAAAPTVLKPPVRGEVRSIVHRYMTHLLGFNPRLDSYIQQLE